MTNATKLAACAAVIALAGCRAGEPEPVRQDTGPPDYKLDIFTGCDSEPKLAAPTVSPPPPNPARHTRIPLRGKAPKAVSILAKTSSGVPPSAPVNADGSFCIDVELVADAQNTVTLTPRSQQGCPGLSTKLTIRHQTPKTGADGGVSKPTNVAKRATVTSDPLPKEGSATNVVDGDDTSYATFQFRDLELGSNCNKAAWVKIDLGKVYTLSKIRIKWAKNAGSDYAKCFAVVTSSKPAPGKPTTTTGGAWTLQKQDKSASSSVQELTIQGDRAQWVALLMYENNSTSWDETFKLAEIEVIGQDPNAVPNPADSCNN